MPKMNGLFLCNFFVDKLRSICYNQNDLWIAYEEGKVDHRLDVFNCIASSFQLPYFPSYTLSKWRNKSMQKILAHMWPYNFLHFSQQYTVHIMARREKNRAGFFLCARVQVTASPFSPANMCIYIMVARRKTTGRLRWLVAARIDHGHILPMVNANVAQICSDGATRLLWNLRS